MLTKKQITELFHKLNDALAGKGEVGEVVIVGGAVMCLVYNAREATKDVAAVFEPASMIRKLAEDIADKEGLPPNWLNDAAKVFLRPDFTKEEVFSLFNLRIWAPDPRYMLAMKCISARWDTSDRDDVIFLIKHLKIKHAKNVLDLIEGYYPKNQIPTKTQFFIEEVFEDNSKI